MAGFYDMKEAVRKVAKATAYRTLNLQGSEPNFDEMTQGLAVAICQYYDNVNFDVQIFIDALNRYLKFRNGEKPQFRDPVQYEC